MIVQCAKCGTKFRLDETKIGQRGAKVRCSKCQHSFVVKRPPPVDAPAPAPTPSPAARPVGFDPDTDPTARVRIEDALKQKSAPVALGAEATVPAGFDLDEPSTDQTSPPPDLRTDPDFSAPRVPATDPELPGLPTSGPELPNLPGTSLELPELPGPPPRDPIHEVQTAVYMVPESIRAAAQKKEQERAANAPPAPGLSPQDVAAIDLDADDDDRTGVVPPEVLAQVRAASSAPADDIPSADADLLDDDDVTLVSDSPESTPRDPAEGLDALPGDPFANAPTGGLPPVVDPAEGLDALPGDPFANQQSGGGGLPADLFSDTAPDGALGRIQPAVVGGDGPPAAEAETEESEANPASVAPVPLQEEITKKPPEPVAAEGRKGWSLGVKLVTTVVGLAILGVGVLLWMGGGRLDLSLIGLGKTGASKTAAHYKDVHPVAMRSVLYPTRAGQQILVFSGHAENRAGKLRKNVEAIAELRNRKGELVASARGPVGLELDPGHLADLTDRDSLTEAYADVAREQGEPAVPSRGVAPFTVVLLEPPESVSELDHSVRLAKGKPVVVPKPPPAPEPEESEPAVESDGEEERKGKRKRKGKRRRRKKAKSSSDETE